MPVRRSAGSHLQNRAIRKGLRQQHVARQAEVTCTRATAATRLPATSSTLELLRRDDLEAFPISRALSVPSVDNLHELRRHRIRELHLLTTAWHRVYPTTPADHDTGDSRHPRHLITGTSQTCQIDLNSDLRKRSIWT